MLQTADPQSSLFEQIRAAKPVLWLNPAHSTAEHALSQLGDAAIDVQQAHSNWQKLAPLLEAAFAELAASRGVIQSELLPAPALQTALGLSPASGQLLIKGDHALPVAGSIKARGGIYEVCMTAWSMALGEGLIDLNDSPEKLLQAKVQRYFASQRIAVGSTGNLGLSVGLAARALGFNAVVHMSHDAKGWKIRRLTDIGAEVVQHRADYAKAVEQARLQALDDPNTYFVDDERSELLFEGYSAAAIELRAQLAALDIPVDAEHPLFLYLPCGIGGAPGGITYGARQVFGDHAHCFFVEPVQAPCALVQMASGSETPVSVYDFGLNNRTEADGMAVPQVSQYVTQMVRHLLSGIFTVDDDSLFRWLQLAEQSVGIKLEPSAASCFGGPAFLTRSDAGRAYLQKHQLNAANASHVLWVTGGELIPDGQYQQFLDKAARLTA